MNTPAHLLIGAAAMGRPGQARVTTAAVLGALAPDLSLYLMVSVSIWGMGIPAETVFRQLYYSDAWQAVFAVDNSFVLWGAGLLLALWRKSPVFIAFTGAALLHLAFDFPLHTHDARQHFWPLSSWVFESPVSYWDSRAHADIVGPVALMISFGCLAWIWRQYRSLAFKAFAALLAAAELMSSGIWRFIF
ncbi:cobalamin biosynthesis protein CobQ [Alphaproteobacteria bacterium GH1-50]|uniref:Cobalamin biosynthesis protein CobQ n=1 Tax=Kangsaoukella pontilimi TaxID=2691042 RepID=A0A7C9IQQ8_9RHOB|nr:cobalamin biosynthesis protein CobQ [Kangsaoukella pontilimi]MXQ08003.1 cobalamin biosynthesis protein CobQ [Kangsaoukella pontilimi]